MTAANDNGRYAWAEPQVESVAAGVHRIPLPLPGDALRAANVYVVEDGDGLVLVDAGADSDVSREALDAGLAALGRSIADVSLILATHAHFDHYGQATKLRQRCGAEVLLCSMEGTTLRVAMDPPTWQESFEQRRAWLDSYGAGSIIRTFESQARAWELEAVDSPGRWSEPDRLIEPDEEIRLQHRRLQVIHTPGHTRGHVGFFDPDAGLFFAGDHVLPHITPSIGFEPFADGLGLARFLSSLMRVRDLPAKLVLPGHGPVFDDLPGRVDWLLAHHAERLQACVDFIASDGPVDAVAVAKHLGWTRHHRSFDELDPLNRLLAVSETIAHLEVLHLDRRVDRADGHHITFASRGFGEVQLPGERSDWSLTDGRPF